jgi:tetratricopeptide (TPR) repeat protein/opacity protein-like surface antigen
LAEIWLSFGELNKALEAAQKAVSLNPDLSRTQTVLGFAYLTQVKTKKAKEAFQKAIELDQADPLPRLGLGLAKIRDGGFPKWDPALSKMLDAGLQEGTKDLETAVSLDPDNSLVRSYLGKAYYEKTEDKLATDQLEMAKKVDPMDPTPYFYDAIRKQATNQPVEALEDLQKAIELNDNRAVYRSRQLLDEDLAARSASLARIYTDLGFQQRALVEGWKSVNTDPADFSGHRFLADTYSALPRHEIARVSELLRSQLLQPINITPIQPRLAESNLFLISGGGPGALSFNEFNPVFNRDRIAFQGSGLWGENNTYAGEGVLSGIYKKLSFSAGYTHFETDGWRTNADQDDDIANAFVQLELSPQTSIQAEYRYRDIKNGDLQLRFFRDDFLSNLREEDETNLARLGFHHVFSPGSDLIGNFQYHVRDGSQGLEPVPTIVRIDTETDEDAYGGELQYLFRSRRINIVSGAGYFNINSTDKITTQIFLPFPFGGSFLETFDGDAKHTNFYLYAYINFPRNVTFTLGGSGDFFDADDPLTKDKNQFNPKFGITWNPFPGTTLRGAAFRVLKRTLITDQTLEPTQVAGFNQFFDEANTTESWRYGAAIDQKFTKDIYGGAEYTYRDLKVPFNITTLGVSTLEEADWNEKIFRAYLFWTPHKWLALSAEYQWERFGRDKEFAEGAKTVKTHYFPLGINFFHPSGLSAMLKASYVNQHGEFERQMALGTFERGKDDFWLFDAAISYRLPKRYGFFTVGAKNLFDKEFQHFDTDPDNPRIQPKRFFFARVTLALP